MGDHSVVCNGASAGQRGHRPPASSITLFWACSITRHTRIILIICSKKKNYSNHQAHKREVSNHGGESVLLLTSFLIHTAAAFFTCQIKLPFSFTMLPPRDYPVQSTGYRVRNSQQISSVCAPKRSAGCVSMCIVTPTRKRCRSGTTEPK